MRYSLLIVFGVASTGLIAASSTRAQQPYWQQQRSAASAAKVDQRGTDSDPLRAYSTKDAPNRAGNSSRAAKEAPSPALTRTNYTAQRRSYFPGMRSGQGPNHNYVPPEKLCSPGRRPYIHPQQQQQTQQR